MKDIYFIECGIRRKGEYHVCEYCGVKTIRRLNGKQKYCSVGCSSKAKQKQIQLTCSTCGKVFERTKSKLNNSKHGVYFCSKTCKISAQSLTSTCPDSKKFLPSHYGTSKHVTNEEIIFFNEPGHGRRKGKKFVCEQCNKDFITRIDFKQKYCSQQCKTDYDKTLHFKKPCKNCGKIATRRFKEIKKSKTKNIFCNSSCAASYNNTLKRKSRRSKVEIMLFEMLKKEFHNLDFVANDRKMLDGLEIDIAVPSLKLGVEWNGAVHFNPIYGQTKLDRIQELDAKKQIVAKQKGINLIVIPDLVSTKAKVIEAFASVSKIIRLLTN